MRGLLYLIFALSGAAGLAYEMIWARYLALFVGHSAYAQVLVIAIFLGGMALGAIWAAARSDGWRDPLKGYAAAELGAGLIGVFFHELYGAATGLAYGTLFPELAGTPLVAVSQWTLAALLILPQSMLLGATFPLMAAGVLRRWPDLPGRSLSLLYFTNSLGAAIGVLVAGFYLIRLAGLPGTVLIAALVNLAVALVAAAVAYRTAAATEIRVSGAAEAPASGGEAAPAPLPTHRLVRILLAVSFGTAVASFAYEIGWLRMLALVLGSATHSFELMLSAFILGLALGAFWVRHRADRWDRPIRALGIVQCLMGLAALATLFLYSASFWWTAGIIQTFGRTDAGYVGFNLARYAICLAIMLPATFCAGMTLPLITRTLLVGGAGERSIGQVYGANTLGSIVGVAAAALLVLPWIGLRNLMLAGASLDMALGVALLYLQARPGRAVRRRLPHTALAGSLAAILIVVAAGDFDHRLLRTGVYRDGVIGDLDATEELFYADGRTATVSVHRDVTDGRVVISTNGKTDGSLAPRWFEACHDSTARQPLTGDDATQTLIPIIALAHATEPREAAAIGQGTGMTGHFLLGDDRLEAVTTIEIEPQMIEGSRRFYPVNRRVFDDPRSRFVIDDARAYFSTTPGRYDVIVSEPSNPWVSGVANLFTAEFYSRIRRALSERGIFAQWLHLYASDDALVMSVLAAIDRNFASWDLFLMNSVDMLIVASPAPVLPHPDWSIVARPAIARDLCHALPLRSWTLEAARLAHGRTLRPLLARYAHPNSDYYPTLDLLAERARYLRNNAAGFLALARADFDVAAPFSGHRMGERAGPVPAVPGIPRVQALALGAALRDPAAVPDSNARPSAFEPARYRVAGWRRMLGTDRPPTDWKMWLANFRIVDDDLNGGRRGRPDRGFYDRAIAYTQRHDAPRAARAIVALRYSLAAWDFRTAAEAADVLLADSAHLAGWIRPDRLLEAGLTAKLLVRDVRGAERFYESLAPYRTPSWDLKMRLLTAHLEAAGGAPDPEHSVAANR